MTTFNVLRLDRGAGNFYIMKVDADRVKKINEFDPKSNLKA